MDMDVDMDVPYNVSVFLIRRPILEREAAAYYTYLPFPPSPRTPTTPRCLLPDSEWVSM